MDISLYIRKKKKENKGFFYFEYFISCGNSV